MAKEESTRAASRKTRVYVFREFLLSNDMYGDYLKEGDIILDAAGGKGDFSWLMCNADGFDSVVIDPRVTKNHIEKSVAYLRSHPDEAQKRSIPNLLTYQPLATLIPKLEGKQEFQSPNHLRILMDEDLISAVRRRRTMMQKSENDKDKGREEWETYWKAAILKGRLAQTLGYEEKETTPNQVDESEKAFEKLLQAKLIVGFHPDQSTDFCIELANELGIPFCIVPCCVFPSEFPDRKLVDGSRVRDYSQLIEYLKLKEPTVKMAKLPFNFTETAKNLALYTLPSKAAML